MFQLQESFMHRLKEHQADFPKEWPLDLTQKKNQVECKGLVFDSMGELFEVVQELKNSKKHRQTEVIELDREHLLEECVDSFKYFLELLIFIGVTPEQFFEAYCKKDVVINERLTARY